MESNAMPAEAFRLVNPTQTSIVHALTANAKLARKPGALLRLDEAKGKTVTICGRGPSLTKALDRIPETDHVWGCNAAAQWLIHQGHRVTHGFCFGPERINLPDWEEGLPIVHLFGTLVHPAVVGAVLAKGRRVRFFHGFVKMPRERELAHQLYPKETLVAGLGLNAVNRAVCLAVLMGYERIVALGADCAMAEGPDGLQMYADGSRAVDEQALVGELDGRIWVTKVDMCVSAVDLAAMKLVLGERLELVGDTLPNALAGKSRAWMLAEMPRVAPEGGRVINLKRFRPAFNRTPMVTNLA